MMDILFGVLFKYLQKMRGYTRIVLKIFLAFLEKILQDTFFIATVIGVLQDE